MVVKRHFARGTTCKGNLRWLEKSCWSSFLPEQVCQARCSLPLPWLVLCCLDHSCSGNSLSRVSLFVVAPRTRRSRLLMLREPCLKEACEELAPKNGTRRTCLCLRGAWRRLGGHTMKKTTYFTHACVDICYITFHISVCKSCEKWLYFSFLDLYILLVPPWHRAPSPWVGWSLLVWYASGPAIYPARLILTHSSHFSSELLFYSAETGLVTNLAQLHPSLDHQWFFALGNEALEVQ